MVQPLEDPRPYDRAYLLEVGDHSARRTAGVQWPRERDVEPVRMTVKARALAGMVRQHVSGFEAELLTNLDGHERRARAQPALTQSAEIQ